MKTSFLLFLVNILFVVLPARAEMQGTGETVTRTYFYGGLTGYQQSLFQGFISAQFPKNKTIEQILTNEAGLRTETRLAQALLFRNDSGDVENAVKIIRWVLKNQYTDATGKYYGMWKTTIQNDKLDQNWREFVGCDLIIIYHYYQHLLPADLLADIRTGLIHAAKGAMARNVGADYTNISVMSAFLMDFAGNEFKIESLKTAGLKKSREIYNLYNRHQCFSEYDSPTYYGVTLIGLALWRELASDPIKKMGEELEESLWVEIGNNYHPGLKNMVGPYFRGYGMDMKKYCSITGIWIALALDAEKLAPLPRGKGAKEEEMSNISPILHLGLSIPKSALISMKEFVPGELTEHLVPNKMPGDSLKQVTQLLHPDWMMGGLWGSQRAWNQIKAGTIHWNNATGETEWLLAPGDGKTNIRVTKTGMIIYRADEKSSSINLYVYARDLSKVNFSEKVWRFSAIELTVNTKLKRSWHKITDSKVLNEECAISEEYHGVMKITFQVPATWRKEEPLLEIIPTK